MDYREEYQRWCTSPVFDTHIKQELLSIRDEAEIRDRFYKSLTFGTGGLRGILGAGTNRMNFYTVGKATQGLADYLKTRGAAEKGVVIAYDSRRMSPEFALDTALILAANGIVAYLFESLRPTPMLSFAVRRLGAAAGIVITASHNPAKYNGYKVYFSDGGQIVPPYDGEIIGCVNAVADEKAILHVTKEAALESGMLKLIGGEIDDAYIGELKQLAERFGTACEKQAPLKIVYTPLHGTGNLPVRRILRELGFSDVWVVPEQELPDGNFPSVRSPNPENPSAFSLALQLAERVGADLVLATDPDADRLGVYARGRDGVYHRFSGNMSGLLICEYMLSRMEETGRLPENRRDGAVVTTIVSSDMAKAIAAYYGVTLMETLTGFKYIGEKIRQFETAIAENGGKLDAAKGAYEYLFGFEESYGCLVGTYARDKDAVSAVMVLCEAALYYRAQGLTLWDQMSRMYEKYGYYAETLSDRTEEGEAGATKIARMMELLRAVPQEIGGSRVMAVRDYESGIRREIASGKICRLTLPKSNVLYFEMEDGSWCCVRPSGTEPKIKFYCGVRESSQNVADAHLLRMQESLNGLV